MVCEDQKTEKLLQKRFYSCPRWKGTEGRDKRDFNDSNLIDNVSHNVYKFNILQIILQAVVSGYLTKISLDLAK